MSVYTQINQQQLSDFLALYSIGTAVDFKGIEAGVENTNYFVTTTQGKYVLTIFETITAKELPFYFNLLQRLGGNNLPVPTPQKSQSDCFSHLLAEKPAALFNRILGSSITNPSENQCAEMGGYLAKLHLSSSLNQSDKKKPSALVKSQAIFNTIKSTLATQDVTLIESELAFQEANIPLNLPSGIIHADLFKDNLLFYQGKISGILDFYDAYHDCFVLDIAITCNDWCVEKSLINQDKLEAFLIGYSKARVLTKDEAAYLPLYLRLAALQFWLSRLSRQLSKKNSALTIKKDPAVFRKLLQSYRA